MNSRYKDQWGGGDFTSAEVDQLVELARLNARGVQTVDARTLSKNVRRWLKQWRYAEQTPRGFVLTSLLGSSYGTDWLPVEAMWRLVEPMLNNGYGGFSVARNAGWSAFNCFEYGRAHHTLRDLEVMERTLCLLSVHGYVYFFQSGTVWEVSTRT